MRSGDSAASLQHCVLKWRIRQRNLIEKVRVCPYSPQSEHRSPLPPMSKEALKHLSDLRHLPLQGLRFRLVDAQGQIVGHLASQVAQILIGKDKPLYTPKKNLGDVVIVINAAHVHFTHDTWKTKLYRWHTGASACVCAREIVA